LIIRKIKVEEGFFDGLDLRFENGLNVLIGGRGVGKTSIIELLRFALGAENFTSTSESESLSHALSILDTGKVSVEVENSNNNPASQISRSYRDESPQQADKISKPIIFSQKEIESVGLDTAGRLRIIDTFIDFKQEGSSRSRIKSEIMSDAAAIAELRREIEEISDTIPKIEDLRKAEKQLVDSQKKLIGKNEDINSTQDDLVSAQESIREIAIRIENLNKIKRQLDIWKENLSNLKVPTDLRNLVINQDDELVQKIPGLLSEDFDTIKKLILNSGKYIGVINDQINNLLNKQQPLEEKARTLRQKFEAYNTDVGKIAKELNLVRDDIASAENLLSILSKKNENLERLFTNCAIKIDVLVSTQNSLFDRRKDVVERLNKTLSPLIEVKLLHLARIDEYERNLKGALSGSGLKYNEIAGIIASNISPQELLQFVVFKQYEEFSQILGLSKERATRLLSYLMTTDLGDVLTSEIEDDAHFYLLDGSKCKSISELSIGQRCTVTLSIILENRKSILVIDQPEDHLDNEFIVETLIKAIKQRGTKCQTIISSHNANIPVLGDATRVTALDSNGRKGYVTCSDSLDTPEVVEAILNTMEGGVKAFAKRSKFYNKADT